MGLDWLTDAFSSELTQRALIGGLLAAVTMALVGSWVVVRGLSFAGDALAHGVLPGIALAVLWGFDVTIGALASAVVMMLGVSVARRMAATSNVRLATMGKTTHRLMPQWRPSVTRAGRS